MRHRLMLGCALLLGATCLPAAAATPDFAPDTAAAAGAVRITVMGRVNLRELAAHQRAMRTGAAHRPREVPRPRLLNAGQAAATPITIPSNVTVLPPLNNTPSGFVGIYEGMNAATIGGEVEPPDQGLAVNNGVVAEIVNDSFAVFDSSGRLLATPIYDQILFGLDSSYSSGDPHVEFDASSQRWFIDEYLTSANFNGFALAVSVSSDPLGSYILYKVDADTANVPKCAGSCFPDYPQVGYDGNGFYIAADLFSNVTGGFVAAAVYALPKAQLIAGLPLTYQYFLLHDFVVEPSIPAVAGAYAPAANGTEYLLTARQIYNRSNDLRVYAISNTNAIGTGKGLLIQHVDLPAEPYAATVPAKEPNMVGPYGRSIGATTSPALDGGYNAFGSGVKYLNGNLYGALTSGARDSTGFARDVTAWFKVTPRATLTGMTASIAAQGYIVPPDGYSILYPGIALNASGRGIIGTTITNRDASLPGGYPSAGYVRFAADAPSPIYRVNGQGAATDDGFTGYLGAGPAGVGRWGDFSSATIDPVTGLFYVANEFIPDTMVYPRGTYANWGTFVTKTQ